MTRRVKVRILADRCQRCGACVDICPEGLFVQDDGDVPRIPQQKGCTSCGHCASICPVGAVDHVDFPECRKECETNRRVKPTWFSSIPL